MQLDRQENIYHALKHESQGRGRILWNIDNNSYSRFINIQKGSTTLNSWSLVKLA